MLQCLTSLNGAQCYIPLQLSESTDKGHREREREKKKQSKVRWNGHIIKRMLVFHNNGSEYKTKEETLKRKTELNMGVTEWKMSHSKK